MADVPTAADIAGMVGWSPNRVRTWLRAAVDNGHPLVGSHARNARWLFSADEARRLAQEIAASRAENPAHDGCDLRVAHASASANYVAEVLRTAVPISAGRLPKIPAKPGLYAWWQPGGLIPGVAQAATGATSNAGLELTYVGIAESLQDRFADHLGSSTGSSTLRRALGAWLAEQQGWVTEVRGGRRQHTKESEKALTEWMTSNLWLTWVARPAPAEVERDVISLLRRPLNHAHNSSHPNWPQNKLARASWREGLSSGGES